MSDGIWRGVTHVTLRSPYLGGGGTSVTNLPGILELRSNEEKIVDGRDTSKGVREMSKSHVDNPQLNNMI